jgi:Uma2 family endonuclease
MGDPAVRQATYEDLLQAPEHLVAEILNGQLYTHPRPAPRHSRASSILGGKFTEPFDLGRGGPGGWWILDEPELHLGSDVLVPDLAGWRRERMPELPETAWFEFSPDWVCEILSPGTAQTDRSIKMPLYAKNEVGHLWLVDPLIRTLEAYELKGSHWSLITTLKDEDQVRLPPFDAIEFPLGDLWG